MSNNTSKTSLIPFDYQGNSIRVIRDEHGEPWWIAADISAILEYRSASDMARYLDEDEKGAHSVRTPSGIQNMIIVNEPGLYSAIMKSRRPEAKAFKRFITHELLPTLRRSGYYALDAHPSANAQTAAMAALDALNDTVIQQFTALVNLSESAHALPRKEAVRIAAKAYLLASGHDLAPLLLIEPDDTNPNHAVTVAPGRIASKPSKHKPSNASSIPSNPLDRIPESAKLERMMCIGEYVELVMSTRKYGDFSARTTTARELGVPLNMVLRGYALHRAMQRIHAVCPAAFDAIRNGALKNPICTIARTVGPLDDAALHDLAQKIVSGLVTRL